MDPNQKLLSAVLGTALGLFTYLLWEWWKLHREDRAYLLPWEPEKKAEEDDGTVPQVPPQDPE